MSLKELVALQTKAGLTLLISVISVSAPGGGDMLASHISVSLALWIFPQYQPKRPRSCKPTCNRPYPFSPLLPTPTHTCTHTQTGSTPPIASEL